MSPATTSQLIQQLYRLILHEHQQLYAVWQSTDVLQSQYDKVLTPDVVEAHLQGRQTISVRLLQPGTSTAKAGCIDFDAPKDGSDHDALQAVLTQVQRVQTVATDRALSTYLEFSGRRGFHLWLFSEASLPGITWIKALQNLCYLSGYKPKEIYPATATIANDGKASGRPIRLPCGIHQISGKRNGFLPEIVEWADGFPIVPENQVALTAEFQQVSAGAIAGLAEEKVQEPEKRKVVVDSSSNSAGSTPNVLSKIQNLKSADFSVLAPDEHPACINYLIDHGAPTDQDYNSVNLTLSRYAITSSPPKEFCLV